MSNGVKAMTMIAMMMALVAAVAIAWVEVENTEESNKNYATIIFSMITLMLRNVQRQPNTHMHRENERRMEEKKELR